jgi:predicted O-linked N-acetylglucosamine transferase (SPINDLY family)
VALAGTSQRALQGPSTLGAIGLDELVAPDVDHYVALAVALARDAEQRKDLSKRIRAAMQKAPFFDTCSFGAAFGALLERLCTQTSVPAKAIA